MIKIDHSYGIYNVSDDNGYEKQFHSLDDLLSEMLDRAEGYVEESVEIVTYGSDSQSFEDAKELTILAAALSWGRRLYLGDCIKLTIRADYCPEDK